MANFYPTQAPRQETLPSSPNPAHQGGPQYFVPQKDYSGWAVTGFVLSLLGFGIMSLPVSIIGIRDTRSGEKNGKGLAVAGTVISALTVAFGLLFWLVVMVYAAGSGAAYAV